MTLEYVRAKIEIIASIDDNIAGYFQSFFDRLMRMEKFRTANTSEDALDWLLENYHGSDPPRHLLSNFRESTGFALPFIHSVGRQLLDSIPSEPREKLAKKTIKLVFQNGLLQREISKAFPSCSDDALLLEWGVFLSAWPNGIDMIVRYTGKTELIALDLADLRTFRGIFDEWLRATHGYAAMLR